MRWPNQPQTHGIEAREQEAIAFVKMFPDQRLVNNPYKIMLGQGEWTSRTGNLRLRLRPSCPRCSWARVSDDRVIFR